MTFEKFFVHIRDNGLREANKGVNMKLFERCYKESDEYDTDKESGLIILDRRGFATLQCDSLQDHTFYIENDGNFMDKFYADSPDEALINLNKGAFLLPFVILNLHSF